MFWTSPEVNWHRITWTILRGREQCLASQVYNTSDITRDSPIEPLNHPTSPGYETRRWENAKVGFRRERSLPHGRIDNVRELRRPHPRYAGYRFCIVRSSLNVYSSLAGQTVQTAALMYL